MTRLRSIWQKIFRYVLEIGRWVVVVYLLYPLRRRMYFPLEFVRSALGILLLVLFSGKLLYDRVLWKSWVNPSRDLGRDLLTTAISIALVGLVVAAAIFFIGLYLANLLQEMGDPGMLEM